MLIRVEGKSQVEGLKSACRAASNVLDEIAKYVKPGVSTQMLDYICQAYMKHIGVKSVIFGLQSSEAAYAFPACICTSVNTTVCHGIPSCRWLKSGDVMNIDVAITKSGFVGDTSRMFVVDKCIPQTQRLINCCYDAMWAGIAQIKPGNTINSVGLAVQNKAKQYGLNVIKEFCGHGIGKRLHEAPLIPHYFDATYTTPFKAGMVVTIEPILSNNTSSVYTAANGWEIKTNNHNTTAQWEHAVLVTDGGCEILTH